MIITRHNYEEFFILYMDNELGSEERRMVDLFVQQNPDLKDELDLLFQYKLVPDTDLVFENKEELIKTGRNNAITLENYEEWLILYTDNELSSEQKIRVEQFISSNPGVEKELALLQQVKLKAEEIIFADKASLYRTEEKVRPMPVRWWRIAAAAVLLLGIGITTAVVINKRSSAGETGVAKVTKPLPANSKETPVTTTKGSETPLNETVVANNNNPTQLVVKELPANTIAKKEKNNVIKNSLPQNIAIPEVVKEEQAIANNNKPTNDLPQPLNNPNINKNEVANNAVANNNIPKEINKQKDLLTNPPVTNQNSQPSDIVSASYKNTGEVLDQPDEKKNKNRGFFRKIARTFEKRTSMDPTDDNKLLVAGLSIRLK